MDEGRAPERERGEELARAERGRATGVSSRLSSVPRSRSPLIASAAASSVEQRADRDGDLQRQVDRVALLEEVERPVRGRQVGDHAQEQAEQRG